jgi:single-stranded DNA-binding protein
VAKPDLRELPGGGPVCLLRLACLIGQRSPSGVRERPSELGVLLLGPMATRVAHHLYPGRGMVLQGSLQSERWEAGDGPEYEAVCMLVDRVQLLGH